jgi:thiol-disulfide isomerase/thioredoxin
MGIGILIGGLVGFSHFAHTDDGFKLADILNIKNNMTDTSGLDIHSSAHEFSLYTPDGDRISLSEAIGTPVIINFWATWCAPCLIEMPILQELYDTYRPYIYIMAVNAGESKTTVSKFIIENDLTFPILLDPTGSVLNDYQIRAYPTTYFIDRQGGIQEIHVGVLSEKLLDKYLRKIGVFDG